MAFTTRRGRPPKMPQPDTDLGTPELRLKHALNITAEPIDILLEKSLITEAQHRAGLHLRWLYTLRYGAPSLTTRYDAPQGRATEHNTNWRAARERDYLQAIQHLNRHQFYEPILRLAVFNEYPACLSQALRAQALSRPKVAAMLAKSLQDITEGLDLLTIFWASRKHNATGKTHTATAIYPSLPFDA